MKEMIRLTDYNKYWIIMVIRAIRSFRFTAMDIFPAGRGDDAARPDAARRLPTWSNVKRYFSHQDRREERQEPRK